MAQVFAEAETIDDARALAAGGGGPFLVLDAATLRQIEDAEAAGAFEGGMTGSADGAPFSAPGVSGDSSSSAADPAPIENLDLDGALVVSVEGVMETIMDLGDLIESFAGKVLGPMILVPTTELHKWLNGTTDDA